MIWTDLRAHSAQVAMFRRAVGRGRVAHAYLFVGPSGVGKRYVARRIAQSLMCERYPDAELDACGLCSSCKQMQAEVHPDFFSVGLPEGKKELPISAFLGPEDRRGREGLLHELSLRPMTSARRIALIDDADRMNEASANALLKTLEEPPAGAILFLISPSSDALLPTIRSRCQPLLFSALPQRDVADLLVQEDPSIAASDAEAVARLSEGSLDTARQLLEPGLRTLQETIHQGLVARPFAAIETAQRLQSTLEELGGGTAGQREHAGWLLRFAADFLRQTVSPAETVPADVAAFRRCYPPDDPLMVDRITLALDRCLKSSDELHQSMPVPLCLESLCHDLGRILRGVYA